MRALPVEYWEAFWVVKSAVLAAAAAAAASPAAAAAAAAAAPAAYRWRRGSGEFDYSG